MQVDKIELGTVIDHIESGKSAQVMKLLGIDSAYSHRVAVMINVPSKHLGTKDILKIEGKLVSPVAANAIALISPKATVNVIKNGKIVEKYHVKAPPNLIDVGSCPNKNCMSHESGSRFIKPERDNYMCYYCEKRFESKLLLQ